MKLDASSAQTILRSSVEWRIKMKNRSTRTEEQERTMMEIGNLLWLIQRLGVDIPTHEDIKPKVMK